MFFLGYWLALAREKLGLNVCVFSKRYESTMRAQQRNDRSLLMLTEACKITTRVRLGLSNLSFFSKGCLLSTHQNKREQTYSDDNSQFTGMGLQITLYMASRQQVSKAALQFTKLYYICCKGECAETWVVCPRRGKTKTFSKFTWFYRSIVGF